MRILKWMLASVAIAALGSCGGGGSCGNFASCSTSTGGTTPGLASISVVSNVASIPSDGSATATVTATALNSSNAAMTGVVLNFAASAGVVVVTSGTTDANGVATATLSANGSVAAGTPITVTVSSGGVTGKTIVDVVNTSQTVTVTTSSPTMPSNGTASATITALVLGSDNSLQAGVPVIFTATSGGLSPASPITTGANGTASVTLSTAGDPTNRAITVTATSGSSMNTVIVNVTGSAIAVSGPANVSEGTTSTYNVTLTDSGGAGIPSQPVTVTTSAADQINGGTAGAPATITTGSNGQVSFTMTAAAGTAETLTVSALSTSVGAAKVTATQQVSVSTDSFAFSSPAANTTVTLGNSQAITVQWLNGGAPVADGTTVNFSTTRGLFAGNLVSTTATTSGGLATVDISSTSAGPASITAGGTDPATMAAVSAQLPVTFVASTPASISVQASPATISTSAPDNQSTITATVRDSNDNLVAGVTVDFQLTDITGGSISVGSAVTTSQGVASTTYTSSSTASANSNVKITASLPVFPAVTAQSVTLTVGGQALFLSLGTGNTVSPLGTTQFEFPYAVQAIDSAGNAVPNATITLTVQSVPFIKADLGTPSEPVAWAMGFWAYNGTTWSQATASSTNPNTGLTTYTYGITACPNEDENNNGIYDSSVDPGNGTLYPGSVAAVAPGTVTTDANGSATFNVIYPQDHAGWVQVILTASTPVSGTQSSTSATFWLPMLATDVEEENPPPGQISPYGEATTCPTQPP
jgi:Bacterial Ig-like domain (group 1)